MRAFDLIVGSGPRRRSAVRIGSGVLADLEAWTIREPPGRPLLIVTDTTVGPLHAEGLARRLRRAGVSVSLIALPPGERSKSRRGLARIHDALVDSAAGRDAAVMSVGGGMVGDLAGFAAATWHRGVPVIHVPTTLLAMVDAALGGKTAINLPAGKNLLGAFHQPAALWADVATLRTLPTRLYREGSAELVKTAFIADERLFGRLERSTGRLLRRDEAALVRVVHDCLRIKGRIVAADEREHGVRAALNFGHTVAHAIEVVSRWRVSHGRAVAIGMCVEARLAARATGLPEEPRRRLEALLTELGLPTGLPPGLSIDALIAATRRDKKARAGRARYALPCALGRMPVDAPTVAVGERSLRAALRRVAN